MKFLFKYTFHLAILACVSALFSGCEQDPKYRVYDYPVPVVESIYPTDGYVTTQVVITGTDFGDRAEAVKVFFGEAQSNKVLGDILVKDGKRAYIFCQENIAAYIMEQLTKIKHTNVKTSLVEGEIEDLKPVLEDIHVIVSAPRFDAIVAAVTKCSRNETLDIFRAKKVTRNGRIEERNSLVLKDGDSFSVRGYGKFRYCGAGSETRKGRVNIYLKKYI